jgi:hypothetical protein
LTAQKGIAPTRDKDEAIDQENAPVAFDARKRAPSLRADEHLKRQTILGTPGFRAKGSHLPLLRFFHIPKTSGTSVTGLLKLLYGRENVWLVLHRPNQEISRYRVWTGHFEWGSFLAHHRPGDRTMIFLRDPRARLLSTIYFFKSTRSGLDSALDRMSAPYKFPIKDVLKRAKLTRFWPLYAEIDNTYLRRLVGLRNVSDFQITDPAASTELALARLEQFDIIGLCERMDESRSAIAAGLGISEVPAMPELNRARDFDRSTKHARIEPEKLDDESEEMIRALTRYDSIIYERALRLFSARRRLSIDPFNPLG